MIDNNQDVLFHILLFIDNKTLYRLKCVNKKLIVDINLILSNHYFWMTKENDDLNYKLFINQLRNARARFFIQINFKRYHNEQFYKDIVNEYYTDFVNEQYVVCHNN